MWAVTSTIKGALPFASVEHNLHCYPNLCLAEINDCSLLQPKIKFGLQSFCPELFTNLTSFHSSEIWAKLSIGPREKCFSHTPFHSEAYLISCPQTNLSLCGGQWEPSLRSY